MSMSYIILLSELRKMKAVSKHIVVITDILLYVYSQLQIDTIFLKISFKKLLKGNIKACYLSNRLNYEVNMF